MYNPNDIQGWKQSKFFEAGKETRSLALQIQSQITEQSLKGRRRHKMNKSMDGIFRGPHSRSRGTPALTVDRANNYS